MECVNQDIAARLEQCGIALTRQRVLIAHVLFSRCAHWSADQLRAKVNEGRPEVSKATVYNTLRLFVAHGLVRAVIADPDRVFYDSNPSPHHHFFDVTSGQLMDIPQDSITLAKLPALPALPAGCDMEGVEIVLRIRSRV